MLSWFFAFLGIFEIKLLQRTVFKTRLIVLDITMILLLEIFEILYYRKLYKIVVNVNFVWLISHAPRVCV